MTNHSGLGEGLGTIVSLPWAARQPRATLLAAPSTHDEGVPGCVGRCRNGGEWPQPAEGLKEKMLLTPGRGPPSLPGSIRDSQPAPKHCWVRRGPPPNLPVSGSGRPRPRLPVQKLQNPGSLPPATQAPGTLPGEPCSRPPAPPGGGDPPRPRRGFGSPLPTCSLPLSPFPRHPHSLPQPPHTNSRALTAPRAVPSSASGPLSHGLPQVSRPPAPQRGSAEERKGSQAQDSTAALACTLPSSSSTGRQRSSSPGPRPPPLPAYRCVLLP